MSKIDLKLNYDEIVKRIDGERTAYKPSEWASLVGVSKNVITNIHGKTKQKPSLEYTVAVARVTQKPVEYYLFGELENTNRNKIGDSINEEIKQSCRDLEVILTSGDQSARLAILSTIKALKESSIKTRAKRRKKISNL
jgi:hypothetical protein